MEALKLWLRPIDSEPHARYILAQTTAAFLWLALFHALATLATGPTSLLDAGVLLVFGAWARIFSSRVAAAVLLVVASMAMTLSVGAALGLFQGAGAPLPLAALFLVFSLRALEATCFLQGDARSTQVLVAAVAILVGSAAIVGLWRVQAMFAWEALVDAGVAEVNRQAPIQVDELTLLDRAVKGPGRALSYEYTLATQDTKMLGDDAFWERLRDSLLAGARKGMQPFGDQRIRLLYVYRDLAGDEVRRIELEPSEYATPPK